MSRTSTAATPPMAKSTASQPTQSNSMCVPSDKVAARAYQKWLQGGCKHGNDQKDWLEAEAEIKAEMTRTAKK